MKEDGNFDFHKEEYNNLKKEIDSLIIGITDGLRYSITLSGIIFAWNLSFAKENIEFNQFPLSSIWFLPAAVSAAFALTALNMHLHIRRIGLYLRKIEERYGDKNLGWENYFSNNRTYAKYIYGFTWVSIIICDLFFG